MTWALILTVWLLVAVLLGLLLGRVLRTRRREDSRPGYITDQTMR